MDISHVEGRAEIPEGRPDGSEGNRPDKHHPTAPNRPDYRPTYRPTLRPLHVMAPAGTLVHILMLASAGPVFCFECPLSTQIRRLQ